MGAGELEAAFPGLKNSGFEVTSDKSDRPNCIGWVLNSNLYFDPVIGGSIGGYYWPDGIRKDDTVTAWSELFSLHGFRDCPTADLDVETEKIGIYVGADGNATHVAKQLNTGEWTSKVGKAEDIRHGTLDALVGKEFGTIDKIMSRQRR